MNAASGPTLIAYCWPSGLIEFGPVKPVGAYPLIDLHGPDAIFHGCRLIGTMAQQGKVDTAYRVPGMADAANVDRRLRALDAFAAAVRRELRRLFRQIERKAA